jgi:hypothetical protein
MEVGRGPNWGCSAIRKKTASMIRGTLSVNHEQFCLLVHKAVWPVKDNQLSEEQTVCILRVEVCLLPASCWFLEWLTLQ